MKPATIKRYTN